MSEPITFHSEDFASFLDENNEPAKLYRAVSNKEFRNDPRAARSFAASLNRKMEAFDKLLAYAECEEAWHVFNETGCEQVTTMCAVLMKHGMGLKGVGPYPRNHAEKFIRDLRTAALSAASQERGNGG